MCGIAGIVALDGFDPKLLASMTHLVKYRGPDGYGFAFFRPSENAASEAIHNEDRPPRFASPVVGLGNRRLAILDLSALGDQPMQTEDGALSITYNGEIYNYPEIRKELEKRGHSFRTRTDTEVLLHAYQEWGSECLNRFNGMWSFAIWDRGHQRLFCARDRFGVKPFYYYIGQRCFVFGSEIKQILEFPEVGRSANDMAVFHYLGQGLLDHSEQTFFSGIRQLPAGHFLILDLSKEPLAAEIRRYWELSIRASNSVSDAEACEEFLERFRKAVTLRMRSDVPVGSCLSGGLDSSSVVCLARNVSTSNDFHTFSACFEDKDLDERKYVSEVVGATGVKSHVVFPSYDNFWRNFERLVWHQDEPVGGASVYAQWCVMEAAGGEKVPVLLDGQGGDETLCGYLKFYYFHLWHLFKKADPRVVPEALLWATRGTRCSWTWDDAKRYLPGFLIPSPSLTARIGQRDFLRGHQVCPPDFGAGAGIRERQKADLTWYSLPALLHCEDRNSMAHSVEARLPFLDYELAEFLVNCQVSLKLRNGSSKWILRNAMKGTLPQKIRLRRTKVHFAVPEIRWMKHDLRGRIEEILGSSDFRMGRLLVRKKVQDEFTKFFDGHADSLSAAALFRVLNLELWARIFGLH